MAATEILTSILTLATERNQSFSNSQKIRKIVRPVRSQMTNNNNNNNESNLLRSRVLDDNHS